MSDAGQLNIDGKGSLQGVGIGRNDGTINATTNVTNIHKPAAMRPGVPTCPLPNNVTLFGRGGILDVLVAQLTS